MAGLILVVGGYGVVGRRIAADLATDHPGRVVVAGRHLDRAESVAAAIGNGVRSRRIDVSVPDEIASALGGVDVVVNCIDQSGPGLMWAAIERGIAYTDITPHLTALGRAAAYERVGAAARAAGVRVLLGAGLVPGISSVMVRALADGLGGAETIETALMLSAHDLAGPASFDYLLQELTMCFDLYVDGADRPARPFTLARMVVFPVPIGPRRAYVFPFSDQVLSAHDGCPYGDHPTSQAAACASRAALLLEQQPPPDVEWPCQLWVGHCGGSSLVSEPGRRHRGRRRDRCRTTRTRRYPCRVR